MGVERPIIVGGGVGPMAGVALHARIIEQTLTDGTDQNHLTVLHFSCSSRIPDRTEYLLGKGMENPALGMGEVFRSAWEAIRVLGYEQAGAVGGVPCNTFHAPEIFTVFLQKLEEQNIRIQMIHMLEETVRFLTELFPSLKKVGVLSTTGTRRSSVYRNLLERKGFTVLEVPEEQQNEVQEAIYDPVWGIKAKSPVTERARRQVLRLIEVLRHQGAEAVVLGCTELPLAVPEHDVEGMLLVDPVVALARALVKEA
ncbi:MAG TPA: amino acid racemase, partial [Spirochaetales bacterium]|nr:amino acid racemase [Spirochaetales bacterium]